MNPRERARRRLDAFFQREDAPSQASAAARLGIKQSGFSKLLARGPILEHLDELAAIMGCTVGDLVAPDEGYDPIRHDAPPESPDARVPAPRHLELADTIEGLAAQLDHLALALRREAPAARAARPRRPATYRKAH